MNFSIKSPYPQAYIIMDKNDFSKSWQFKGPRVYVKYEEAKERCEGMNRYTKGKPNVIVGFDLTNGVEVEFQ